jgi:SAM-dependent methyltransferase
VFYGALLETEGAVHVLDAGAGGGEGALRLCRHFARVTAVDRDEEAVAFGRLYAPAVDWVVGDLVQRCAVDQVDLGVFIDVLAHVGDPERALRNVGAQLTEHGRVFIAEPRAYPTQLLLPPQRRGFTMSGLRALLTRAGFRAPTWLSDAGTFLALIAELDFEQEAVALSRTLAILAEPAVLGDTEHEQRRRGALAALEMCRSGGSEAVGFEALLALAEVAALEGDGDTAASMLLEARRRDPRDCRSWAGLAEIALCSGDAESAWTLSSEAINRSVSDARANRVFAQAAHALGDPQAIDAWLHAARLAPDDVRVASNLATVASEQGDYRSGIVAFERLLRYEPEPNTDLHVTFAWLLLMDNQVADATTHARLATVMDPESAAVAQLWQALDQIQGVILPQA